MEHMSKGNEAETSLFAMHNCTVFSFSLYKVICTGFANDRLFSN